MALFIKKLGNMFDRLFDFFESRVEPFPCESGKAPPTSFWPFLWYYSKPMWPWLLTMAFFVAVIAALEITLFAFLGSLVDWLGDRSPATFVEEEQTKLIGMGLLVLLLLPAVGLIASTILHQTVLGNFPMAIRWRAHLHMMGQSFSFYQDEFAGRIAAKLMQTSLAVRETVTKLMDVMVYVVVYFIGALVLTASFDIWLMLPFLFWSGLYTVLLLYFMPRLKATSRAQADSRSEMTGRVVDSYTNIVTVKLFAHAGHETGYARSGMRRFLGTVHAQMRLVTLLNFCLSLLNGLLLFSVAAAGIWLWSTGAASVGAMAVGIGLVLRLQGMSQWIMWELSGLFESVGIVFDGMQMISQHRDVQDKPNAPALSVTKGAINFDQVKFHYDKEEGVLDNIDLAITGGEKIGLVGRSGAGKTTLTNLLLRLFDIEHGRILVDGQNIQYVTQESLRQSIGVVTQDTSLLHRSVVENIAYGRADATLDEVIAAAKRADAHEFILGLEDPSGRTAYDAHVGERGVKLSGGQRQRVAIARMFLKDAPILVLDEATSALDSEVEAAIQENLAALMEGKTVIAIAHRLSTIAAMDRLLVMDAGTIVEQGNHQELSNSGGLYAQLWQRQSGGFLNSHGDVNIDAN
ncbi:MAG: ABC transporter ATP-binding protein [Granulosicoccaceae bacterium]